MEHIKLSFTLEYEPAGQMEYTLSVWVVHLDMMNEPGGHVARLLHLVHPISDVLLQGDIEKYPIGQRALQLVQTLF
jgi:hypothetical protein